MTLDIYQVDAFTDSLFGGNPAAVVPLQSWLPEDTMQLLAMENNLSETVFFVPAANAIADNDADVHDFEIRWFTPDSEINLCGHATLASAHIIFSKLGYVKPLIRFLSKSGILIAYRQGNKITMDFPSWNPAEVTEPPLIRESLGAVPIEGFFGSRDIMVLMPDEKSVRDCEPDFNKLKKAGAKLIITAPGDSCDFVSRFFAPSVGINEDPVTGSAHSQLIPFWSRRLGKTKLHAKQLSKRGGELWCEDLGNRVTMTGSCVFYMQGRFEIEA
jgi:PhzF family phenazine biosynthesis protein